MSTIVCTYTCPHCHLQDVDLDVPAYTPDQGKLEQWMPRVVVPLVAADHAHRSPLCLGPSAPTPALPARGWYTAEELRQDVTMVFDLADIDPDLAKKSPRKGKKKPFLVCKIRLPRPRS